MRRPPELASVRPERLVGFVLTPRPKEADPESEFNYFTQGYAQAIMDIATILGPAGERLLIAFRPTRIGGDE